jgi:hypothetical protein
MFEGDWFNKTSSIPDRSHLFGYQVMLNYCWRHPSANFHLCPYGYLVNYINHNQTLANVRIQWIEEEGMLGHKPERLTKSPYEMKGVYSPGLAVDFIATRDIEPGEVSACCCIKDCDYRAR